MYTKQKMAEMLALGGLTTNVQAVEFYIQDNKIDSVFEDSSGTEFYDDSALEKLQSILIAKTYGVKPGEAVKDLEPLKEDSSSFEIPSVNELELLHETTQNVIFEEQAENYSIETNFELPPIDPPIEVAPEINNEIVQTQQYMPPQVKVDITAETLDTISRALADKITSNVTDFLKESNMLKLSVMIGKLKKENEILVKKLNKNALEIADLRKRVREAEDENSRFVLSFFGLYKKLK